MAMGGQFRPSGENVVGNRLSVLATGVFNSTVSLGSLDTCPLCSPPAASPTVPPTTGFKTPTTNNLVGYVTTSAGAVVKVADCHMPASNATGKCYPAVTLDYSITTIGLDKLELSDSFSGCGSSCFTAQVPPCIPSDGEEDDEGPPCPLQGALPLCTDPDLLCDPKIVASVAAIELTGIQSGGVEACSGNCIVTIVKGTPANKAVGLPFIFGVTGPDVPPLGPFTINTCNKAITPCLENGVGSHTSKELATGPSVPPRYFSVTTYPAGWQTDQISCVSLLNNGTSTYTVAGGSVKGPLTVNTLGNGDTLTCTWHVHHD